MLAISEGLDMLWLFISCSECPETEKAIDTADFEEHLEDTGEEDNLPSDSGNVDIIDNDNDGFDESIDCDDNDPAIYPSALEVVADGVDNNCDGLESCYIDLDGDGYGSMVDTDDDGLIDTIPSLDLFCDDLVETDNAEDCDDNSSYADTVYPGAVEIPNDEIDQDCDGQDLYQDLFNYSKSFAIAKGSSHSSVDFFYADDQGWSSIEHAYTTGSTNEHVFCGLNSLGYVECQGLDHSGNNVNVSIPVSSYIPVETFVDFSVSGQHGMCGLRTDGTVQCWFSNGNTYSPPVINGYNKISLRSNVFCGIDSGVLYCYDTSTDGLLVSDNSLQYKYIENGCGTDGSVISCYQDANLVYEYASNQDIVGLSFSGPLCWVELESFSPNMYRVMCSKLGHSISEEECLYHQPPHSYFLDFFSSDEDLSSIKVSTNSGGTGIGGIVTQNGTEIAWGGRWNSGVLMGNQYTQKINNGYSMQYECNYDWGE